MEHIPWYAIVSNQLILGTIVGIILYILYTKTTNEIVTQPINQTNYSTGMLEYNIKEYDIRQPNVMMTLISNNMQTVNTNYMIYIIFLLIVTITLINNHTIITLFTNAITYIDLPSITRSILIFFCCYPLTFLMTKQLKPKNSMAFNDRFLWIQLIIFSLLDATLSILISHQSNHFIIIGYLMGLVLYGILTTLCSKQFL